jgi:hypothetical protein
MASGGGLMVQIRHNFQLLLMLRHSAPLTSNLTYYCYFLSTTHRVNCYLGNIYNFASRGGLTVENASSAERL